MKYKEHRHISTSQFIFLGFLFTILTGSLILMLPFASKAGKITSFIDAMFTATSATCVTGLVVHDTATFWSEFGQAIILFLIQIGGMGVITIAVLLTMMSGRKISLRQRSLMQEAISAPKMEGIVRLTGFIFKTIITIELLGATFMFPVFYKQFGVVKGIWYAVFHSVSAFCNAGFDLMGIKEPYSSLTTLSDSVMINVVIMALIVIGGLGFITWEDIKKHKYHFRKYKMQSKVIILVTALLIIIPTIYFYFCEFRLGKWDDMSTSNKVMASFFTSITPRTAGFNTVDFTELTGAGQMVIILLMLIGGAPGSTAGGMKVTTMAVIFATAYAVFRRKQEAHFFKRRIATDIIAKAATILLMYVFLFLVSAIVISSIEGLPIVDVMFETASAIGTVGLTLGITTELCTVSKIILIILMFFGRAGGLTIIFAAVSGNNGNITRFPEEKIMVG